MKMYKKSNLSLINGMLVCDSTGDVVVPDAAVVKQANVLETIVQQSHYLFTQPTATPMPSLDGFKRMTIKDDAINDVKFEASTPMLDMQAAKTMQMMDEMDDLETAKKANELLAQFSDLLAFVENDYVVDTGDSALVLFDTPVLGDVLKMTKEDVTKHVAYVAGLSPDDDDETKATPHCGRAVISSKEELDELFEKLSAVFDNDDKDSSEE